MKELVFKIPGFLTSSGTSAEDLRGLRVEDLDKIVVLPRVVRWLQILVLHNATFRVKRVS